LRYSTTFTYPESPLTIVQYERNGREQENGLRLDLDKFAFLDHYAEDIETERTAAKQIVAFLGQANAQTSRAAGAAFSD
jgi:hypothetical protein